MTGLYVAVGVGAYFLLAFLLFGISASVFRIAEVNERYYGGDDALIEELHRRLSAVVTAAGVVERSRDDEFFNANDLAIAINKLTAVCAEVTE